MNNVTTNNHWRELITWDDLTPEEQKEYLHNYSNVDIPYFRYKGDAYGLDDFTKFGTPWAPKIEDAKHPFFGWDAVLNDSAFSGLVIRLNDAGDAVQVGHFYR